MKLKHFLLTALLLFLSVSGVYAGRKYVGFTAVPGGATNYTNTQLQTALNDAQASDTVFVAVGLCIATDSAFLVPANVTLIGGYEKGDATTLTRRYPGQFVPFDSANLSNTTKFTILDGNAYKRSRHTEKHRVVTVQEDGVVDGCLIRNGHVRNGNGGGVLLNGGKLYNSIVRGNVAMSKPDTIESLGGGVFIQNGGELINCLVAYNMANDGYGVAAGTGGGKMINNTITANTYAPVFAKISKGTFNMYKGNYTMSYRPSGAIPKWDAANQLITLNDFYFSRTSTTEGQYAVFCAAIDMSKSGSYGQLDMTVLKALTEPVKGGTIDNRYNFNNVGGPQNILRGITYTNGIVPGLKYDDGVWHPAADTVSVEYPIGGVTWYGALAYSVWLGGGLPSEAQWQFAARREPNGTVNDNLYSGAYGSTVSSGISVDNKDTATYRILDTIAWVTPSASIDTATGKLGATWASRVHEVARKRPNAMGIYDMTGNMREWLGDWYTNDDTFPYTTYPTDPIRTTTSSYRTQTDGTFGSSGRNYFSLTSRAIVNLPNEGNDYSGFRPIVAF